MIRDTIQPCRFCGAQPVLEPIAVNKEERWRVRCPGCHSMTIHFGDAALAVAQWNEPQPNPATRNKHD